MESFDIFDVMEVGSNLSAAVFDGDTELVKNLLENSDPKLNTRDKLGRTLLHYSACRSQVEIVQLLLEKGANPNLKDKNGNTPLHWCGHGDVIELLISHGANVNDRNCIEATPKEMAIRRGVPKDIIKIFRLYEGENKNEDRYFKTLFHEFSDELGTKNLILLILILLFVSLYMAYTITGFSSHLQRSQSITL